jgi:hypothetical protein
MANVRHRQQNREDVVDVLLDIAGALLWSRRGQRNEARGMAMYVCRQLGGMKLEQIARLFGVAGYSTVRSVLTRTRAELDRGVRSHADSTEFGSASKGER